MRKDEIFVINSLVDEVSVNLKSIYKVLADKGDDFTFKYNGSAYYSFLLVIKGKITVETNKNYSFEVGEGNAAFVWSNDINSYSVLEDGSQFFWVWFYLNKKTLPFMNVFSLDITEKLLNDFHNCIKLLKHADVLDAMRANMIFTKYMLRGIEQLESKQNSSSGWYRVKILQSVDYINEHLYDLPTIQELANMEGLSIKQYRKYFKQVVGVYPAKYIYNQKLVSVKDALINTDLSINEISDMMGFSSPYYLSNCFKNTFGVTPSEYRKKYSK